MKSEVLTAYYAPIKRSRQSSAPLSMTTVSPKMPNVDDTISSRQVSLAAAFHDHISCTKSPDLCQQSVLKEEKGHMPCETDHIYANCSSSAADAKLSATPEDPQQRLKDMLLLQLDLIQHQQEQLSKRDRQLQTLRQEKEALKVRLERMERRMSLLKQKKEGVVERTEAAPSTWPVSPTRETKESKPALIKMSTKRPYNSIEGRLPLHPDIPSSPEASLSNPWSTPLVIPSTPPHAVQTSATPQKTVPSSSTTTACSSTPAKRRGRAKPEGMETSLLYPLPLAYVDPEPELANLDPRIEVPSWRYHAMTSYYQLEGTENLEDEIFLRRHHKLEIDEKRRKRWDIQRIREQRHIEKLRRGRSLKGSLRHGSEEGELSSFFPLPREVQYLEVSDAVPVVAFGSILPQLQASEFGLDWFTPTKQVQKEEHNRSRKRSVSRKDP